MIRKHLEKSFDSWLPAYINGTLSPLQHRLVRFWLQRSPAAQTELEQLQKLERVLVQQPKAEPSAAVLTRLQARVQAEGRQATPAARAPWHVWAWGMALVLIAAVVLWQALPPGIILQWSVEGSAPQAFRVYRAPADSDPLTVRAAGETFTLIEESPADPDIQAYTYLDARLLPGQNYVYRVEAIGQDGRPLASQTILGRGQDALPGQIALLATTLVAVYGMWLIGRQWRLQLPRPRLTVI